MSGDTELVLLFGALHALGLVFALGLLVMFLRSDTVQPWTPPHGEGDDSGGDGGGGRPPTPRPRGDGPRGGIPLPSAVQARIRLRAPATLRELRPARERRPAHAPAPAAPRVPQVR